MKVKLKNTLLALTLVTKTTIHKHDWIERGMFSNATYKIQTVGLIKKGIFEIQFLTVWL